ncbi:UNVERIFIED_CONTAM: hypothetical protein Scaly_2040400 [Sesamum calycinum]|uniref:CCHC-type domain-containing protein n=1 Tax=Sesamum calycinum TaxID=2727403 RepID=A0AAW2N398_9LAMI
MEAEFNRMKTALSLTESKDAGVVVASSLWYSESDSYDLYLVGRLLSSRLFHADALKSTLLLAFNPGRGMDLKPLEGNRFLLKFNHIVDRNRVLEECPWSFEKNFLILSSIDLNENPQEVNLDWTYFHVHVHGLPLSKMSRDMAVFVGNFLGRFVEVDMDSSGHVWGSHMRIRVSIDITKPLKRVMRIRTTLGDEQLLSFAYERLPNFCYLCGSLGHLSMFCELRFSDDFVDPGEATPFGPWLRATNLPTGCNRGFSGTRNLSVRSLHPPFRIALLGRPLEYHLISSREGQPSLVPSPPLPPHPLTCPSLDFAIQTGSPLSPTALHRSLPVQPIDSSSFAPILPSPLIFPITHITTQTTTLPTSCPVIKPKKMPPRKVVTIPKKQKQPELPSSLVNLCTNSSPPTVKRRTSLSDISNTVAVAAGQPRRES